MQSAIMEGAQNLDDYDINIIGENMHGRSVETKSSGWRNE